MVATELSNVVVNVSMATVTTVPSRTAMKAAAAITADDRDRCAGRAARSRSTGSVDLGCYVHGNET